MTTPKTTIPLRLELEYMVDQRRLHRQLEWFTVASLQKFTERTDPAEFMEFFMRGLVLNERKARVRLRQIARDVERQKRNELAQIFGRRPRQDVSAIISDWVDEQSELARKSVDSWVQQIGALLLQRQDADTSLISQIRQLAENASKQRQSRASAAILQLNSEIIESAARGEGSSHYRWSTTMDGRQREWHGVLDKSIQSWDKPPAGGGTKAGDRGHPGSGFGCRCLPEPIPGRQEKRVPAATLLEKRLSEEIETKYKGRLKPSMTIEQAEDAIKTYKVEHGMVWDVDGTPLARLKGAKGSVRFPPHVVNRIKARGRATVFTHNHPNGNPTLSAGDLHAAVFMNQHRTRVITARGGMEMRVIDAAKWEHARQQRVFIEVDFKRAEKAAAQAGRDAVDRQFANVQYFSREVVDQSDAVYVEAMATEALKQYNRIGEKYGFTVTRF